MAKRKVKWGVSKDEPDDLQDFASNDEIVGEHGWPKPGVVRLRIKQITHVTNKAGDPMLKILAIHDDTSKDRKKFNGYALFENQNVTDVSEQFLKRFLNSMGASWADFRLRTVEDTDADPVRIVKIGSIALDDKSLEKKPVYAWATIGKRNDEEYGESMIVRRWLVRTDKDEDEEDEDADVEEDEEAAEEESEVEEIDEDEAEEADEDEEAEESEEETELREELDGMNPPALRKRLRDSHGWKPADYKGQDKATLIDNIVALELGEDEEEAEEDGEDEEAGSDRRAELDAMKDPALKKLLRDEYGYTAADYKGSDHAALVDLVMEEEDEGEPPF